MDSLFSSKSPFNDDKKMRPFYFPSPNLNKTPVHASRLLEFDSTPTVELEKDDLAFAQSSGIILTDQVPTSDLPNFDESSGSSKYNETWPSTDHTVADTSLKPKDDDHSIPVERRQGNVAGSTLSKYIERFRKNPPSKPDQRNVAMIGEAPMDFWWLSPPSLSSTPTTDKSSPSKKAPGKKTSYFVENDQGSSIILGKNTRARKIGKNDKNEKGKAQGSSLDKEPVEDIEQIQLKADKLIEFSESTMSTISSSTSDERIAPEASTNKQVNKPAMTVQGQPLISTLDQQRKSHILINSEEDILQQWRLARRLEQAREKAVSSFNFVDDRKLHLDLKSGIDVSRQHLPQPVIVTSLGTQLYSGNSDTITKSGEAVYEARNCGQEIIGNERGNHKLMSTTGTPEEPGKLDRIKIKDSSTQTNGFQLYNGNGPHGKRCNVEIPSHTHLTCNIVPCEHPKHRVNINQRMKQTKVSSSERTSASAPVRSDDMCPLVKSNENEAGVGEERRRMDKTCTLEVDRAVKGNQKQVDHPAVLRTQTSRPRVKRVERPQSSRGEESSSNLNYVGTTRGVASAISQVVTENLFLSPADSGNSQSSHSSTDVDFDMLYEESSEEEFANDEMLKTLRLKRKYYLSRLRLLKKLMRLDSENRPKGMLT